MGIQKFCRGKSSTDITTHQCTCNPNNPRYSEMHLTMQVHTPSNFLNVSKYTHNHSHPSKHNCPLGPSTVINASQYTFETKSNIIPKQRRSQEFSTDWGLWIIPEKICRGSPRTNSPSSKAQIEEACVVRLNKLYSPQKCDETVMKQTELLKMFVRKTN